MTTEELRQKLLDYYGTATGIAPWAFIDVSAIERADRETLIAYAAKAGINVESMMPVSDMCEALEQYYESAGFADFYNRRLRYMSKEEIIRLYAETFKDMD